MSHGPIVKIHNKPSWLPHNSRPRGVIVDTVVIHSTADSAVVPAENVIRYMRTAAVSYHYMIDRDGTIHKLVPIQKRAWHAGKSHGPQGPDVNDYSIGISFVNMNNGEDPYTEEQHKSAVWLINELKRQTPIRFITAHYNISPGRKTDPRGYDMERLASETGTVWWGKSSEESKKFGPKTARTKSKGAVKSDTGIEGKSADSTPKTPILEVKPKPTNPEPPKTTSPKPEEKSADKDTPPPGDKT